MTSHHPQHLHVTAQAPLPNDSDQQQLLQEIGAQFSSANVCYSDIPQALKGLPGHCQAATSHTPQLGAVLGRTASTKGDVIKLLNSDVVASLSSKNPR
ncbi:hypothetical protein F4821DRAFT_235394 [Hypoxylon rubiginosum]|uniref:Uncharacterized protein n=1 Tax=Hypoxylon rubiginosum TaxID=110542 RepID=A0ACC0D568_9PEZI|nr:hypothetical protein F4821DRAFT_235394 [Hypoxylon rubiginosum]